MSEIVTEKDYRKAQWGMVGVVLPYGFTPGSRMDGGITVIKTEQEWTEYQWNPPEYLKERYEQADARASGKPSWSDVIIAIQYGRIDDRTIDAEQILSGLYYADGVSKTLNDWKEEVKDKFVDRNPVYVEGGLGHIGSLLQMVEHSNEAGADLSHVVVRNDKQRQMSIWRQGDLREILADTARRENIVESAHNIVMEKYYVEAGIRDDENNSLNNREEASEKALGIIQNYETNIKLAMATYDPDSLPPDLPTLKDVLQERLEAAAMRKVKELKGAATNQGVLAEPSCVDQETAVKTISTECAKGVLAILAAEDTDEAKSEFDDAVEAINRVTPINTPHWRISGRDVSGGANPPTYLVTGNSVEITAKQPNADIEGRTTIRRIPTVVSKLTGEPVEHTKVVRKNATQSLWHEVDVTLPMGTTEEVLITVFASNVCGESKIVVALSP